MAASRSPSARTAGVRRAEASARRVLTQGRAAAFGAAHRARERFDRLTPREQDVLRLVGQGLTNAEIGAELSLAPGTVKVHISAVLRTTGARNRVEAALVAVRADEA